MSARARLLIAVVVAGLTASLVAVWMTTARAGEDPCVRRTHAAADRRALVTGAGDETLVIGDSWSVGYGIDPSDSWPTRLPGRVRVDGFSGSGYSAGASLCPDVDFATRAAGAVRPETQRVVLEGGLNDFDQPPAAIDAGFRRLMATVGDRDVIVVGPPLAPSRATQVREVDVLLADLSEEYGVRYLPMRDLELPYLDDGLHPTAEGHRIFGDEVARRIVG